PDHTDDHSGDQDDEPDDDHACLRELVGVVPPVNSRLRPLSRCAHRSIPIPPPGARTHRLLTARRTSCDKPTATCRVRAACGDAGCPASRARTSPPPRPPASPPTPATPWHGPPAGL